ncbi:MAG: tetratricopeptide repeat protein [Bacteroidales bacterium]|nr:tetratricopeptide repeat protein [Bacteroidales bacterium]
MKTHLYIIVLTAMLLPLAAVSQTEQQKDALQYAAYLVNNGKSALAYPELNKLIAQSPSLHYAYYLRALNYYNDGNPKSALYDIEQALKRRPTDGNYLMLRGDIHILMGKYGKAAESYSKAARDEDAPSQRIYAAALAYLRDNDYANATKYASRLLDATPDSDSAKMLAAEIYIADFNTTDALRLINTVSKHDASFYRLRGIAYCKSQMNDLAINDLNSALDIDPSLSDIYVWRGLAKYQSGDRKAAHSDWNTAISLRQYAAKDMLQKYR